MLKCLLICGRLAQQDEAVYRNDPCVMVGGLDDKA